MALWYWEDNTEDLEGVCVNVPFQKPRMPRRLAGDRNRPTAVGGRQLTAWSVGLPVILKSHNMFWFWRVRLLLTLRTVSSTCQDWYRVHMALQGLCVMGGGHVLWQGWEFCTETCGSLYGIEGFGWSNSTAHLDTSCDFNDDAAKPIRLFLCWVGIITEWFTKTIHWRINTGAHGPAFFDNSKGQLISVSVVKTLWTSRGVNLPTRPKSAPDENAASHVPTALTCKKPSVPTERGRDSSVGIATRYGLDGPGIECRWGGARFSAPIQTDTGDHPASYTLRTASFPGVKRPRRGVHHPTQLAPMLKKEYSYNSNPFLGLRGLF